MHVESIRTLDGPNVFHRKPVLSLYLRLGDLTDVNSDQVPGFNERLIAALPGLKDHHCSRGYIGGFCERLRLGTYFGHVTEHVALELAGLLGSRVTYGKTRYAGEPGLYQVLVRYQSEAAMRSLLHSAVRFVDAVVAGEWVGSPTSGIQKGVIRGFVTQASADSVNLLDSLGISDVSGTMRLSTLLPGGSNSSISMLGISKTFTPCNAAFSMSRCPNVADHVANIADYKNIFNINRNIY